ncbi:uncharacterized protein BO95DRAFT_363536 [Aspergillus brunneoviolaceus CBS 621.78]|uniref:Uncharacterized protein n=1 Tax=Aspergillus brunneoviolaceus CBS 621.78 TaxID=1450534 RepID=A0ACD1G8U0_9EURO|nr:hypothetical protein BO95DRAFT_363536 [Aspergillus brunneoviolaceus CBS 621.78]RAH45632.1 hypothetical protein BO95DRAFT_363536 [Aspergillus brunneoviolaceus CBS 621.78]
MTTANCTGPECTYVGPDSGATPGRCTQTAGYIANAEINEIIATNPTVQVLFDSGSDSDIIVYNETQWVGYMTNTTKSTRTTYYQGLNMGGTTEWAIDLESFITSPTDATAFGEYLVELKAEVDDDETEFIATNQTCSDPSSGDESGLQASEERGVAAYVNWLVEDSLKSPTEWTRKMFMSTGAGATQCDLYPDGECPFPTGFCSDYNVSAEYWAEYVVANAYQYITELGSLFDFATQNETLSIDAIVDDFPVKSGATVPDWATILTNVGGVMGIVGSAIPGLDAEADTTMIGTLSGIFSLAGSDVSSADATDAETTTLEAAVQTVYSGMYQSVKDTLIALFETGDISSWPSDLRTGDYTFEVANFLNGRYMFELTGTQASDIENTFNSYLRQYLVGTALVSANYYILKGAYSTSKCASVSSGTVIGDYCYTLEYPGAGWELVKQIMTDPISSDDLTKLTDTYGVDLETLYSNSYTCQNTTGTYSGVVDIDVLTASSTVPTCFFNLPVFTVETSDEPTINNFLSSPCLVWDRNTTAKTAELGVTWMPSNLADVFVRDFCECNASGRECSEV